ncbi:hypothetical protein SAMN05421736_1388 [Evansella caseinilytica]|uniref:Uncharacterized protein n=1 Tax=Evansella caseinilytica TaxID=1503961 RepID=A0A1H3V225_9BACI|nr:hypothetical protein [Evansella caseinilytica]SDZ68724.1 hypothetical protein SAMN05421736_1388 [Evansella caseinilytica]
MSRKLKTFIVLSSTILIIMGSYFTYIQLKEDEAEIEKVVSSLKQPLVNMYHIEMVDGKNALVFYEWGYPTEANYGMVQVKKSLLGWKFVYGVSDNHRRFDDAIGWFYTELEDFLVLRGPVKYSVIADVLVITKDGKKYEAEIVRSENQKGQWFLIAEDEDFNEATLVARDEDGQIIEEHVIVAD